MLEHAHAIADKIDNLFRNISVNDFFAIDRGGGKDDTVRIDYHGGAAQGHAIIHSYTIRQNEIALIFDRARKGKKPEMFDSNDWPGR